AVRSRDEMLAMVSHDLRTALGAIKLTAERLAKEMPSKGVGVILRSADHMARLTRDLLDVRAIELGRLSLHWKPHSIGTIAAEVVETCMPLAAKKGVSLTSGGDDATVVCDRDRVLQVLWNVVTNAVKFCRDNGAVRVCTRYAGNEVCISVT